MPPRIKGPPQRGRHFIREWREHRDLTQAELAFKLEMSEASLSRIESRKQPYTQDFLEACAMALSVQPAWLISRKPQDGGALDDFPEDIRAQAAAYAKGLMDSRK